MTTAVAPEAAGTRERTPARPIFSAGGTKEYPQPGITLWPATKRGEKSPDYFGSVFAEGKQHEVIVWANEKDGRRYLAFSEVVRSAGQPSSSTRIGFAHAVNQEKGQPLNPEAVPYILGNFDGYPAPLRGEVTGEASAEDMRKVGFTEEVISNREASKHPLFWAPLNKDDMYFGISLWPVYSTAEMAPDFRGIVHFGNERHQVAAWINEKLETGERYIALKKVTYSDAGEVLYTNYGYAHATNVEHDQPLQGDRTPYILGNFDGHEKPVRGYVGQQASAELLKAIGFDESVIRNWFAKKAAQAPRPAAQSKPPV